MVNNEQTILLPVDIFEVTEKGEVLIKDKDLAARIKNAKEKEDSSVKPCIADHVTIHIPPDPGLRA